MDEDERRLLQVRTHVGLIIQADDVELARELIRFVSDFCKKTPGLVFVHKDLSVDKLWLKRGAGP